MERAIDKGFRWLFGVLGVGAALGAVYSFHADALMGAVISFCVGVFLVGFTLAVIVAGLYLRRPFGRKLLGCLLLLWLVAATLFGAPLRAGFLLSKHALERILEEELSGQPVQLPRRAGVYVVHRIDANDYGTRLIVRDTWSGPTGFVFFPEGERVGFNPFEEIALGEGWFYIEED
jgi:hypothetical protein